MAVKNLKKLTHLDAFSSIGGFAKAGELVGEIQTTQFIENNLDAQLVLRSHLSDIPIHNDIRTYSPRIREFDLFTIGFPCTGTSNAGGRAGLDYPESALWRESLRCICIGRPQFIVVEQPEGFIQRGLRTVFGALRVAGYSFDPPLLLSAAETGAMHRRNRVFAVSYSDQLQFKQQPTSWDDQVRKVMERQKVNSHWLSVERTSDGRKANRRRHRTSNGIPRGLVCYPLAVPTNTPGRIRSRILARRCVTPAQAAIALTRVLYLNKLTA